MKKHIAAIFIIFIISFIVPQKVFCAHLNKEKIYQNTWCNYMNGTSEKILNDKSRIDCVFSKSNKIYVVEVEFAKKWAESVGQSLYYAAKTNYAPSILLIIEDQKKDVKQITKLSVLAKKYNIKLYIITPNDLKEFKLKEVN